MNHQPYETWILEEQEISSLQRQQLLEHLEICPKCASIEKNWKTARQEVRSMPAVEAPIGFSTKWHASLAMRQKRHERHQARVLLISLVSSAVAIFITLGIFLLPHTSIITLLINFVSDLMRLFNSVNQLWTLFTSILKAAPVNLLIGVGLLSSLFISLISVIWALSFYRITMKGIKTSNEN